MVGRLAINKGRDQRGRWREALALGEDSEEGGRFRLMLR